MSNLPDPIPTVTWKNTLNANLFFVKGSPNCSLIEQQVLSLQMAQTCNYPYFVLKNTVYSTATNQPINLSVEELDYYL